MKNILIVLLLAFVLYGCSRHVPCSDTGIEVGFIGFLKSDFDSVILRKYEANSNYQQLVDTSFFINDSNTVYQRNDTILPNSGYQRYGIETGNDWQIYLPKAHRLISISNIKTEQNSIRCQFTITKSQCYCINKIYSVQLDNVVVDLSNVNPNQQAYTIFIH